MAEHTYKPQPGELFAVEAQAGEWVDWFGETVLRFRIPNWDHDWSHALKWNPRDDGPYVAPFLSADDQSSLLRVVRAALELFSPPPETPWRSWRDQDALGAKVRDALVALSPELRDRAARLSEGE